VRFPKGTDRQHPPRRAHGAAPAREQSPVPIQVRPLLRAREGGEGCEECADHGTVVVYEKRATTMEGEYVEIVGVERQPLHWADDDEAEAWGHETREDYIEDWQERHGRSVSDTYVVRFRYAVDMPILLAKHGDYTHSDFDAVAEEPEAVDRGTLERFTRDAHERDGLRMELKREERKLSEWMAELENDPTTSAHQLASVRKRLEQIEKRRRRRAA
jgi:hypothetical protein